MTRTFGDRGLADRVQKMLGPRHMVVAVASVAGDSTALASVGAPLDADYEIGSISKGITGLLYEDARERGHVGEATTLGDVFPLGDAAAGGVLLSDIATHRSGLPRLPLSGSTIRRTVELHTSGRNPYRETLRDLLDQASRVSLGRPVPRYSTFGFELLGHAVAAASGTTYADLLDARLAKPLGLSGLYAPESPTDLRATAVGGRSRTGRPMQPWTGAALAPAGGIRASIIDLARLTSALLDGSAPGVSALDPIAPFSGRAVGIGAAWITIGLGASEVTWHNGGTGGFRSWLGLDRTAGTGVVLLTARYSAVDRHGFALLAGLRG